jgi:hypothetical protein
VLRGVTIAAGVHGGTGCGGGGEDIIVAEVVAGQRSAEVGGGSGTRVDMLGGRELPTPPAPSKWTYSTMKLSYIGVEPLSTAVPCPPSPFVEHYVARRAHTLCPWVKNAAGLRALHVADEHTWSAPIVELADVAKLIAECEAAEDP